MLSQRETFCVEALNNSLGFSDISRLLQLAHSSTEFYLKTLLYKLSDKMELQIIIKALEQK